MIRKPKGPTAKRRAAKKRKLDAEYAKNRLKVIERDGGLCRRCGVFDYENEVHHIKPRSLGVDHSTSNLVLLCLVCHDNIHSKLLKVSGDADVTLIFEVLR